jgi:PKD repeat protein
MQITFIILLFSTIILTQDEYYEVKLTPENPSFGTFFGNHVSIDGSNALVMGDNSIDFYFYVNSEWQINQVVVGDEFLFSLFGVISEIDEDYCIAGYYTGDNSLEDAQKLEIYHLSDGFWSLDTIITKSDMQDSSITVFPVYASIKDSLIVATALTTYKSRAYLFENIEGHWMIQTFFEKEISESFGISFSIKDGMICLGAPAVNQGDIEDAGAVFCYQFDGSEWNELPSINPPWPGENRYFGYEVLLIDEFLLVGEPGGWQFDTYCGSVWVYQFNGFEWIYLAHLFASDYGSWDQFGSQVKGAGTKVCIGAWGHDDGGSGSGAVYVYDISSFQDVGENVIYEEKKIISSDLASADNFGFSLDVTDNLVIVGAPMKDNLSGAAYIFGLNDTTLHANFAGDVRNGNAPVTVQFTAVPQGNPTAYEWDFNSDGFIDSTEPNPQFTYHIDGVYTVTLTVYDETGSDSEIKEDYIQVVSDILFGDVNGDGFLDVSDLVMYIDFILGYSEPEEDQFLAGDVNYSGQIDIIDIVMVIDEILGN